jgi:GT2 family glycosyltransferase
MSITKLIRKYIVLSKSGILIIKNEGWNTFFKRFREWRRSKKPLYSIRNRLINVPSEWQQYLLTKQRIYEISDKYFSSVVIKHPYQITISNDKIKENVEILDFQTYSHPHVSIIIPIYNNLKLTVECLKSIHTYTKDVSYEIIIVDDNSEKEHFIILSSIPNIKIIQNNQNIGFLRSCNHGAELAQGKYLLFLNNDVQVTKGWLQPLVDTFIKNTNVGAVGPRVLYPNGRLQEAGVRIKSDGTSEMIGLSDNPELPRYKYIRDVDYCSGACLLVETDLFRTLKGFDTTFTPAYCEDADLCLRIHDLGKRVLFNPNSTVIHHLGGTMKPGNENKYNLVIRNQQKFFQRWNRYIDNSNRPRVIAFYLPQYHPIPENDRWWGKGFTEWSNVTSAKPNFKGHYQPHLPADLGYYDLRLPEIMQQQALLARKYGIHGFCYYYYWFNGKRLLEKPIEAILHSSKFEMPFCLCWANENWTRKWDGKDSEILISQKHSDEDDKAMICDVIRYMKNHNYIRINGKPLFLIYRVGLFPDIKRSVSIWRETCRKEGIGDIYLALVESFERANITEPPSAIGFDASVEFPPHNGAVEINTPKPLINSSFEGVVCDYREVMMKYLQKEIPSYTRFRTVMPGWDNTPRQPNKSYIFLNSSPSIYQVWLEEIISQTCQQNYGDERILMVAAWNEWAEGNHLEPDKHFGHGFLEATRNALECNLLRKL